MSTPITPSVLLPADALTPVSERRGYIGGSDWYELLKGCQLRLWKVKRGAGRDEPTGAMIRGTKIEPLIVEEYQLQTDRKVRRENRLLVHPAVPQACAHIDRWTWPLAGPRDAALKGRGILECKSANPWVFRNFKREGLHDYYISQMQWYLFVTGVKWGAFAILEPVDWQFEVFVVHRDEALMKLLYERAVEFWKLVENGPAPDKLDPHSSQCRRCRLREECHPYEPETVDAGDVERDDELEPMAAALKEARAIAKDAKEHEDDVKEILTEALGKRTHVAAGDLIVTRTTTPRAAYTVAEANVTTIRIKEQKQ